jgi:Trypsin
MTKKKLTLSTSAKSSVSFFAGEIKSIRELRDSGDHKWREKGHRLLAELSALKADLASQELHAMLLLFPSDPVLPGEFPECVAIGNDDEGFFASGVLLNEQWLLTSSHARTAQRGFAGIDISQQPVSFDIEFKGVDDNGRGLLALFEVKGLTPDPKAPIDLPELPPEDCLVQGTRMQVVAFGNTDPGGGTFGRKRKARFDVEDAGDVRIYASSQSGVCTGDSGGPAFYYGKKKPRMLVGIADSVIGDDCALGGVFATLVGKATWINDITKLKLQVGQCPDPNQLEEE